MKKPRVQGRFALEVCRLNAVASAASVKELKKSWNARRTGVSNAAQRMGFGHDGGLWTSWVSSAKTPVDSVVVSFFPTGVVEFLEDKAMESMGLVLYIYLHVP